MIENLKEILKTSLKPFLDCASIKALLNLISEYSKNKVFYMEGDVTNPLPIDYNMYVLVPTITEEEEITIPLPDKMEYDGAEVVILNKSDNTGDFTIETEAHIYPTGSLSRVTPGSTARLVYDGKNHTWIVLSVNLTVM